MKIILGIFYILLIPLAAGAYYFVGHGSGAMWGAAAMSLSSFCVCMGHASIKSVQGSQCKQDEHGKGEVSEK